MIVSKIYCGSTQITAVYRNGELIWGDGAEKRFGGVLEEILLSASVDISPGASKALFSDTAGVVLVIEAAVQTGASRVAPTAVSIQSSVEAELSMPRIGAATAGLDISAEYEVNHDVSPSVPAKCDETSLAGYEVEGWVSPSRAHQANAEAEVGAEATSSVSPSHSAAANETELMHSEADIHAARAHPSVHKATVSAAGETEVNCSESVPAGLDEPVVGSTSADGSMSPAHRTKANAATAADSDSDIRAAGAHNVNGIGSITAGSDSNVRASAAHPGEASVCAAAESGSDMLASPSVPTIQACIIETGGSPDLSTGNAVEAGGCEAEISAGCDSLSVSVSPVAGTMVNQGAAVEPAAEYRTDPTSASQMDKVICADVDVAAAADRAAHIGGSTLVRAGHSAAIDLGGVLPVEARGTVRSEGVCALSKGMSSDLLAAARVEHITNAELKSGAPRRVVGQTVCQCEVSAALSFGIVSVDWLYPVQTGTNLYIRQVYAVEQNGTQLKLY